MIKMGMFVTRVRKGDIMNSIRVSIQIANALPEWKAFCSKTKGDMLTTHLKTQG